MNNIDPNKLHAIKGTTLIEIMNVVNAVKNTRGGGVTYIPGQCFRFTLPTHSTPPRSTTRPPDFLAVDLTLKTGGAGDADNPPTFIYTAKDRQTGDTIADDLTPEQNREHGVYAAATKGIICTVSGEWKLWLCDEFPVTKPACEEEA